ncbi:MAG: hypothetical protein Q8K92_00055 [Leadbetterella sp.]|nr:hypothetical protein [Leadbetterella sp.]
MQNQQFPISGGSFRMISMAFYTAIDNKDIDVFQALNSFLYNQLYETYESGNLGTFEQFSHLYPYYYEYVLQKKANSGNYIEIYEFCAERVMRDAKQKIGFPYMMHSEELTLEQKEEINSFSAIMINRMGDIMRTCLAYKDIEKLPLLINQLHNIRGPFYNKLIELKYQITWDRKSGKSAEEIAALVRRYNAENFTDQSIRLLIKAGLFWAFFLYNMQVYSLDDLNTFLKIYDGYSAYVTTDLISDLILLRSGFSEGRYSWGKWDYMKRLDGVYSPPMVVNWATRGAVYFLLRQGQPLQFDLEEKTTEEINGYEFAADAMLEILNNIPKDAFEKFGSIVKAENEPAFLDKIEKLKEQVILMNKYVAENKEYLLSQEHLHPEFVENFKRIVCEAWDHGNTIRVLFHYFDKMEHLTTVPDDIKLLGVGVRNRVWEGYKKFLIKDENLSGRLVGFDNLGTELATNEENTFFMELVSKKASVVREVFAGLDIAIDKLVEAGASPSVVMIGIDTWYRFMNDGTHNEFIFSWNEKASFPFPDFGGTYRKIPIVKFRSPLMKNNILVADFKRSFLLQEEVFKDAFKEVLVNNITEIDGAKADEIIDGNQAVWLNGVTRETAKHKLMNSILVDFYLHERFVIQNEDAFVRMVLKERDEEFVDLT